MKSKALLFLFIFTCFLFTPTVICLINDQVNVSFVFSLAEEENKTGEKAAKEVQLDTANDSHLFSQLELFKISFCAFLNLKIEAVYLNLISPPPKL